LGAPSRIRDTHRKPWLRPQGKVRPVWIEKCPAESGMKIRSLDGKAVKGKGPAEVNQLLDDPTTDWNKLFGEASVFRKLKDK